MTGRKHWVEQDRGGHRGNPRTRRRYAVASAAAAGAIVLLLGTVGGCRTRTGGTDAGVHLVLTGSSTVAPLAAEIGRRYEQLHASARVDVQTGGSARGIADARQGLADIGMVSRGLHESESDLTAYTIGRDGIAMIVHADNPVSELSAAQIVDIYTGKIRDWKAVGGPPGPITVVNKAQGRSTLELFLRYFALEPGQIRADVVIGDNQQGIKTVGGNPGALGYVSIGAAEVEIGLGTKIRLLPLDGIAASTETVAAGEFPLLRELNLVTRGPAQGPAAAFIRFATSAAVDDLIRAQFFVPPRR